MAEFNVTPQTQQPGSYTGLSQGIRSSADTGLGTLFEGLAQTLDAGIKEQDRNIKANIEEDIFAEVDSVQGEFGIPEATDMERDAEEASFATAPMGVKRAKDQLDRLQAAYAAGGLKESHYWARMNNMVRQLRGKYPGYRGEIDQMVASVTGARPANALRSALMQEWEAASRESGEMDKFIERVAGDTGLPLDFYTRMEAGNPYSKNELTAYYSRKKRQKFDSESRQTAMAEEAKRNELQESTAERNFQVEANQTVQTILQDATSTAGSSFSELQERVAEAQQAAASGSPMDQAETDELRAMMGQLRANVETAVRQVALKAWDDDPSHSYSVVLKKEQIDNAIQEAMAPINILEDAIANENWGILGAQAAYIEATKNDASRELIEDMPHARKIIAAREMLGPDLFGQLLSLSGKSQVAIDKALLDYWNAASVAGEGETISDAFADGEAKGRPESFFNGLVDQWTKTVDAVANGEMDIKAISAKVDYMFGGGAEILSKLDDESRFEYFRKVTSPRTTKMMMQVRDSGDSQASQKWETYQRWTANTFTLLFKQKVDTLQNLVINPQFYEVDWDPKNNRFTVNARLLGSNLTVKTPFISDVNQLNSAIQSIAPIIEENDGDTAMEVMNLILSMGYNPDAQPEGNQIMSRMFEAVRNALAKGQRNMAVGRAGVQAGSMVPEDTSPWEPAINLGPLKIGGSARDFDEYRRRRAERERGGQ